VWGGSPAAFVRNLDQQEQLNNYAASYSAGANEGAESFQLWPREQGQADMGSEDIKDYAERKYFENL